MNKIIVDKENIILEQSDELINLTLSDKLDIFDVTKIKLEILGSTDIEITYKKNASIKLDFWVIINKNINVNIDEINESKELKIRYKYDILENSCLNLNKFYNTNTVKELNVVSLDGEKSQINYNLKTIALDEQKYDIYVYHNYNNTVSNISNKGVNIKEGILTFNVTSIVYNGIKNCVLNQYNRIINLNNFKCNINPILLIEEQDVIANHSAYIGTFDENAMFYLKSRGINEQDAIKLLIKGFLLEKENKKIEKIIDKYWR